MSALAGQQRPRPSAPEARERAAVVLLAVSVMISSAASTDPAESRVCSTASMTCTDSSIRGSPALRIP